MRPPYPVEKWRHDIREYEAAHMVSGLVGEAARVLNVGPSWGRDWFALTERGKQVVNLDIAPQARLPDTVSADASKRWPFPDECFDAVLLAEVLEHLVEDWVTLGEARRVLRGKGRLVVTVPFYSDGAPYHIRVHSPRSIQRLLAASGFEVEQVIWRGGLVRARRLVHAVRKALHPVGLDGGFYRLVLAADRWWGMQAWSRPTAAGAYIVARKGTALDWRGLNTGVFQHP